MDRKQDGQIKKSAVDGLADVEQHKRFVDAARQLGCDTNEEAFNDVLRAIGSAKRAAPKPKRSRKSKAPADE